METNDMITLKLTFLELWNMRIALNLRARSLNDEVARLDSDDKCKAFLCEELAEVEALRGKVIKLSDEWYDQ